MKNLRQTKPGESTMDTFHSIVMDTFDTACNVKTRLGGVYLSGCHVMDGQKYVCMDEVMNDILNKECIVYSFGIGGDMSFEKGISEMGFKVFAYIQRLIKHRINLRISLLRRLGSLEFQVMTKITKH